MAVNMAETVPDEESTPSAPPMDSMITDFLIKKFGGAGVQGANTQGGMSPPSPDIPPTLTPALPPTPMNNAAPDAPMPRPRPGGAPPPPPMTGSANAAPMPPSVPMPPPTTGSANASAPPPQPPGPMLRPGSYADIAFNALRGAFTSGPSGGGGGGASGGAGSANAAPVGPPIPPSAPAAAPSAAPPTGGNPYSAMVPDWIKNALKYSVGSGGRPDNLGALQYSVGSGGRDSAPAAASGRGSANANPGGSTTYPPKDTGATGDEFAARRQGEKIGPPNTQPYKATPSTRYTKPYARGGVKEGQRPPAQKQQARAQAPRGVGASAPMQTKRASAAPQTARSGRSAYAQSLIDSMGPRGAGVTTYIEPATGNEILTGNGIYQNLGKTSTGTQKPAFTKFFN